MTTRIAIWQIAWASLVLGCGGRVDAPTEPETGGGTPATEEQQTQKPSELTALGECSGGFDPWVEQDHPCNWVDRLGTCYDTKLEACECLCPRDDPRSTCQSPFYQGDGMATPVYCY